MPSFVGYDAISYGPPKSSVDHELTTDKKVSLQIDELKRISQSERDKFLGRDYFEDIEDFYNLEDDSDSFPSYRPQVKIPQLQTLVLNEATDISDSSPKIFINAEGQREKEREKFFQANWRQGCFNNRILEAFVWSMLSNLGFLQAGFDPLARRGRGSTWLEMRHPKTVFPDPYCKSEGDWSWVIWEDLMYIDEVQRRWPDRGKYVKPHLYAASPDPYGTRAGSLDF